MAKQDSIFKVFGVTGLLCFVCSLLVCTAVVSLKSLQEQSIKVDRELSILAAADVSVADGQKVSDVYAQNIEARLLDVATGEFVPAQEVAKVAGAGVTADDFDFVSNSKLAGKNITLSADADLAKIRQISKYMPVYLVKSAGGYSKVILPFYGQGLWSVMYGYLALSTDGNTILGVKYYSHGETPGLGAEIENPNWTQKWQQKKIFDANGAVEFAVLKKVEKPEYQVDALSGATLTSDGVSRSVRFWASESGYGKFLQNIQKNGVK